MSPRAKQSKTTKATKATKAAPQPQEPQALVMPGAQVEDTDSGTRLPMAAYAALQTRRPQLMEMLRKSVQSGAQALTPQEIDGLLGVCVAAVHWMDDQHERDRRTAELAATLRDLAVATRDTAAKLWPLAHALEVALATDAIGREAVDTVVDTVVEGNRAAERARGGSAR